MAETSETLTARIEELLKLFHEEGGVFTALRDIKAELYKLNERLASEEKRSAEAARKSDEALRSRGEAESKERAEKSEALEKSLRALQQSLEQSMEQSIGALPRRDEGLREEMSKSFEEASSTAAARSSEIVQTLGRIAGALTSHGDSLDRRGDAIGFGVRRFAQANRHAGPRRVGAGGRAEKGHARARSRA